MSLDEPVIVSVITVEEVSLVVDVLTPPAVSSAIDVTVIDPLAAIVVDVTGGSGGVITFEETGFLVDVVVPPALSAVDVTVGNPAATIVVDIPGDFEDEVIGGKITIASTAPSSPSVNDVWIDTA